MQIGARSVVEIQRRVVRVDEARGIIIGDRRHSGKRALRRQQPQLILFDGVTLSNETV